jgi:hypothetical protein
MIDTRTRERNIYSPAAQCVPGKRREPMNTNKILTSAQATAVADA